MDKFFGEKKTTTPNKSPKWKQEVESLNTLCLIEDQLQDPQASNRETQVPWVTSEEGTTGSYLGSSRNKGGGVPPDEV